MLHRELPTSKELIDEIRDWHAKDAGAAVIDDEGDVKRSGGRFDLDDLSDVATFPQDETVAVRSPTGISLRSTAVTCTILTCGTAGPPRCADVSTSSIRTKAATQKPNETKTSQENRRLGAFPF